MKKIPTVVIFGGAGYIAGYTVNALLELPSIQQIVLVDIAQPRKEVWTQLSHEAFSNGRLTYIKGDVREPIGDVIDSADLIFNFAAIHREPGHEPYEYFETNIKGAENVVEFAERIGCERLLFTSSIAPYGHANIARTETSPVVPYSPYGSSKLVAEKLHEAWLSRDPERRQLITVRPGVIFGPHEDGNVPRLREALRKGIFCYVGNKGVCKSGGYVKELVDTFFWTMSWMSENEKNFVLYNFSLPTPPTLEEYVDTTKAVLGVHRFVPTLPFGALLATSHLVQAVASVFGVDQPIHPERVRKLKVDNQIIPQFLIDQGYPFKYSLSQSLEDWKRDVPDEW